jgi:hypothetical protein
VQGYQPWQKMEIMPFRPDVESMNRHARDLSVLRDRSYCVKQRIRADDLFYYACLRLDKIKNSMTEAD